MDHQRLRTPNRHWRASDRAEAERKLARYIASKYVPARRERDLVEIPVADVLNIYLTDAVPGQARPDKAVERAGRVLDFFGTMTLDQITGSACRAYTMAGAGQGRSRQRVRKDARRTNGRSVTCADFFCS